MKNVRAVAMHQNACLFLTVNVAAGVIAFFDDQTPLAVPHGLMRKDCAVKSAADDQIIILFHKASFPHLYILWLNGKTSIHYFPLFVK